VIPALGGVKRAGATPFGAMIHCQPRQHNSTDVMDTSFPNEGMIDFYDQRMF